LALNNNHSPFALLLQIQKIQAQQIQTQVQVPPNREYEDAMPSFVNNDDEYRYESSATPRINFRFSCSVSTLAIFPFTLVTNCRFSIFTSADTNPSLA
jgi:hypothetical protein